MNLALRPKPSSSAALPVRRTASSGRLVISASVPSKSRSNRISGCFANWASSAGQVSGAGVIYAGLRRETGG